MDPYTEMFLSLKELSEALSNLMDKDLVRFNTSIDVNDYTIKKWSDTVRNSCSLAINEANKIISELESDYIDCEADDCDNQFLSQRKQRFCCDNCSGRMRGKKFRYRRKNPILAAIDDAGEASNREMGEGQDA